MAVVELARAPSLPELYGRALAGLLPLRRPAGDSVPDTELVLRQVSVAPERLAEYARVCGFRLADPLPVSYPHVLAFPLALRLMTWPGFPFPAARVIHVANRIEQRRPLLMGEPLDLAVWVENLQARHAGRQVDVVATGSVGGVEVWRDVSTYLHRTGSGGGGRPEPAEPPEPAAVWRVPAGIGRAYAAVSGDRNPIHLSTLAAKAAGFRRRIAHGMWTKARCLAQLAGRLPDAYTVEVEFQAPLLLPSTVGFAATESDAGWRFTVHSQPSGKPHLAGEIRWPAAG